MILLSHVFSKREKEGQDHPNMFYVPSSMFHVKSGLTLLELLIVMAILLILLSSSIFVTYNYYVRNQVDSTISVIVETTRRTQTLSRNAVEDSAWGIKITDTGIILFKANDGDGDGNPDSFGEASRDDAFDREYIFPPEVEIVESSQVELIFNKLTGIPQIGSNITIEVKAGNYSRPVSINELGTVNYAYNTGTGVSCTVERESCLVHRNAGCNLDGNYLITNGGSPVEAYCNMTINGGGWTKLNGNLATITVNKGTASWSGSNIVGTGLGTGCGVNIRQYTLSTPPFSYNSVYVLLNRTTSILQCSAIGGADAGWYTAPYLGGFTSRTACVWNDGIWANGTSTDMTNLKLDWAFTKIGTNAPLYYDTQCSSSDSGGFTMQWFVK